MKVTIQTEQGRSTTRFGPLCIACGNTRRFWVGTPTVERLMEVANLPDGDVNIVSCGRCRSQRAIVVARVD